MKITKINAIPNLDTKKNVAAYARVSNGKDAMLHSLSSQVSYYSNYIQSHDDWEYVGVYADEALTGTKDTRENFQCLLADCRAGKIDFVITKSISRFARNTVTLLETVRELKNLGIGIFFEEQNIDTLSSDGELMLSILASYAQEESLSASENVKWRIHNDYEQGILPLSVQNIYGYKRTDDGGLVIVPDEAETVRRIYSLFLEGEGCLKIARILTEDGVPSNSYERWTEKKVRYILSNEKYIGDLLLQKSYRTDHLTKKTRRNKGEKTQYYVENNHEPIISKETYEAVQLELERRREKHCKTTIPQKYAFTGKIECGNCGKNYRRKVTKTRVVWICSIIMDKENTESLRGSNPMEAFLMSESEVNTVPKKPKRPCSHPGCPKLKDGRFCEEHQRQENQRYEKYDRDPAVRRRYGRVWKRIRDTYVASHPLCERCQQEGKLVPTQEVHHILPLSEGGTHARDNLIALCQACHSKIHAERGDRWNK